MVNGLFGIYFLGFNTLKSELSAYNEVFDN